MALARILTLCPETADPEVDAEIKVDPEVAVATGVDLGVAPDGMDLEAVDPEVATEVVAYLEVDLVMVLEVALEAVDAESLDPEVAPGMAVVLGVSPIAVDPEVAGESPGLALERAPEAKE